MKHSGSRGLVEVPASLVRLTADLLAETRAALRGAPPEKVGTGFSVRRRDHSGHRVRKSALPRLRPSEPVSHAELCVIAGQARALLAAFIAARGLDKPSAAPNPRIDMIRAKLERLIDSKIEEGVERRMAEAKSAGVGAEISPSR
jgi:hypothetical protein